MCVSAMNRFLSEQAAFRRQLRASANRSRGNDVFARALRVLHAIHAPTSGTPDARRCGMRAFVLFLTVLAITSSTAFAGESQPAPRRPDAAERGLTKDQIERYAAPYFPEIRACYVSYGRWSRNSTGELTLRIVVHRNGGIHELAIEAPGVAGANLRELTRCIRNTVENWRFPVRRDFTTAILPYYLMHLDLPSAGPQLSCWNPKGCPDKRNDR